MSTWKKGQSGNPKGRPKKTEKQRIKELFSDNDFDGLKEMIIMFKDLKKEKKSERTRLEIIKELTKYQYPMRKAVEYPIEQDEKELPVLEIKLNA